MHSELQSAFEKFQQGDLRTAKSMYEKILKGSPQNPEAKFYLAITEIQLNNPAGALEPLGSLVKDFPQKLEILEPYGACLLSANRVQEACQVLSKVVEMNPRAIGALKNLAHAYSLSGLHEDALRYLKQARDLEPESVEITIRLARGLNSLGRTEESCEVLERFLNQYQAHLDILFLLGVSYQSRQIWLRAKSAFQSALDLSPDNPDILNNLGVVEHKLGNLERAQEHFERSITLRRDFSQPYTNLGLVLTDRADWLRAEQSLKKALELEPGKLDHWNNLGTLYHKWGRLQDALDTFLNAHRSNPHSADTNMNVGLAYYHLGEKEEALKFYEQACRLEPQNLEYVRNFSIAFPFTPGCPELKRLEDLHQNQTLAPSEKAKICFSLGKAREDLKEYEKAFSFFQEGNQQQRLDIPFHFEMEKKFFRSLEEFFSKELLQSLGNLGASSSRPIFILGMPRSGTTLTEQILSSHPEVYGAGEIPDLKALFFEKKLFHPALNQSLAASLNPADWKEFGDLYVEGLKRYDETHPRVVNKMPANFLFIGCIALMLPNATIIHCHRSPLDTCLSCFKHYFQATHSYKYDLRDLGLYYRLYAQLMDYWREVLPGRFLDLKYEDTVDHPEQQIHKLLNHCGLDFHPDCLDFHQSQRAVKTASAAQVRKPIYRSSLGAWKRYGKALQPLIDSFSEPIEGLKPIQLDLN